MSQKDRHLRAYRMPLNTEVICHINEKYFKGKVRDLSVSGFFMETADYPPIESKCKIKIVLNGAHSRLTIDKLSGIVKRCDEHGVGIELDDKLEWFALIPFCSHKIQKQHMD
jgi:hypothetical protein